MYHDAQETSFTGSPETQQGLLWGEDFVHIIPWGGGRLQTEEVPPQQVLKAWVTSNRQLRHFSYFHVCPNPGQLLLYFKNYGSY